MLGELGWLGGSGRDGMGGWWAGWLGQVGWVGGGKWTSEGGGRMVRLWSGDGGWPGGSAGRAEARVGRSWEVARGGLWVVSGLGELVRWAG